jgi:hypothetical protein
VCTDWAAAALARVRAAAIVAATAALGPSAASTAVLAVAPVVVITAAAAAAAAATSTLVPLGLACAHDALLAALLPSLLALALARRALAAAAQALAVLARLFTGARRSVLRPHVQFSAPFDREQYLAGTLVFSVLLFSVPTLAAFAAVFAAHCTAGLAVVAALRAAVWTALFPPPVPQLLSLRSAPDSLAGLDEPALLPESELQLELDTGSLPRLRVEPQWASSVPGGVALELVPEPPVRVRWGAVAAAAAGDAARSVAAVLAVAR